MTLLKFFFTTLILLTVAVANTAELGRAWPEVIDRLKAKGITRVGDLDLSKFKAQVQSNVQWRSLDSNLRPSFAEGRRSAFYIIEDETVFVSPELPQFTQDSQPNLELHEAMGALKYKDRHYELSTALELLSHMKPSADRKKLLEIYGKTLFDKNKMFENFKTESGGSGSSVGGGGDLIALTVKNRVLAEIIRGKEPVLLDFLKSYPKINFEPIYDRKHTFVAFKYQFVSSQMVQLGQQLPGVEVDPTHGHQELLSIFVPASRWMKNSSERKKLIKEIKERMMELFPAHASTKTALYAPSLCQSDKGSARYPVSKYSDVTIIQGMRAGLNAGCEPFFPYMEVRVPSFEEPEPMTKDVDYFLNGPTGEKEISRSARYSCRLFYDKYQLTDNQGEVVKGKETSQAYATMLPDTSMLIGYLISDARGGIDTLILINSKGKRQKMQELKLTAQRRKVSMKALDGHNVSFTCVRK